MKWSVVEERVAHWFSVLGIPEGKIRFLRPPEFNKLNKLKLRKTDWGRCNRDTNTFTLIAYQMRLRDIDVTILHEVFHLLHPLMNEKRVDDRAELIAGYKRDNAIRATQKKAMSF